MNRAILAVSYAFNEPEKTTLLFINKNINSAKKRQMPNNLFVYRVETFSFSLTYVRQKSKIHLTNIQDTKRKLFIIPTKCNFLISTDINPYPANVDKMVGSCQC
jgi:hypothetical protein